MVLLLITMRRSGADIMRRYLLPETVNFYKANLHAHSTVSDGAFTPGELKSLYKANGYSILACTDHELMVDHSELDDSDFIMLTGMEYAFVEKDDYFSARTIELNLLAKKQHNTKQICFDPSYVIHGEKWRADEIACNEPFKREYTIECIQHVIDEARRNGFLVSLNHPGYSMETPEFFGKLSGLFAMEIYNHISFVGNGVYDYNPAMYDDLLRRGKNMYCISSDDCHSGRADDDPLCDRYGGFVMIAAKELKYESVINSLEQGDFYASQGPVIEKLYIEGDEVHIECSPVKYIAMNTSHRPFGGIRAAEKGGYLTGAVFKLPLGQKYMRFSVTDEYGHHANTRAYFDCEWN